MSVIDEGTWRSQRANPRDALVDARIAVPRTTEAPDPSIRLLVRAPLLLIANPPSPIHTSYWVQSAFMLLGDWWTPHTVTNMHTREHTR